MIVAIDGPAGSGKGTITKNVERKLGFLNLDTGATYRCVALETLRNNLRLDQETEIIKIAKNIKIEIDNKRDKDIIYLNGEDVSTKIREKDLKIYLDASEEIRAQRRYKENQEKGIDMTYEEVLENVRMRDYNDMHKKVGALKKAEDAIIIDSTNLTIEEVTDKVIEEIEKSK